MPILQLCARCTVAMAAAIGFALPLFLRKAAHALARSHALGINNNLSLYKTLRLFPLTSPGESVTLVLHFLLVSFPCISP